MAASLPPWVIPDAESVRREAEPYVNMTPEERLIDLRAACRAAARILRSRADADVALAYVDPLPASSEALLARLRDEARKHPHGR
jgi:hypothetical protein